MVKELLEELQKDADYKGVNIQRVFSDFVDYMYKKVKSENLISTKSSTYLNLVRKYPFQDILGKVCLEIGRFDSKRGQFMTPFELANTLNQMNQNGKMNNPEMLDFSCGTGIMGLATLCKTRSDLCINENMYQLNNDTSVQIHLNDLDNEMTKIATIQVFTNWVIHCQILFDLDLLVTQNNVISGWEEPLKVIYKVHDSVQNFNTLSKAKKKYLMLNPPFGLKDYGIEYAKKKSSQSRFSDGVPNKGDCEYAFILSAIDLLTEDGKAFLILPNSVQSRNSTQKFRKSILQQNILSAVIDLPSKLFDETSIPTCVFMINKKRSEIEKSKGIYMMNLAKVA